MVGYDSVPRKSHGDHVAQPNVIEGMGSRSVSDIHHFVPVVVGSATKLQSDVMIGPLTCEFYGCDEVSINMCSFISRCFRKIEHRFQDPL